MCWRCEPVTQRVPVCMTWPVPDEGMDFWTWQAGRCGNCGVYAPSKLVLDHEHVTGFVRGYLCRGCNTAEGVGRAAHWWRWRSGWNPATLLGSEEVYEGWETTAYRRWLQATEPTVDELREAINKLGT